ncbi:MAG: TRAP transporter substrate-binding protein [Spirochaetales bacterium]|jgi:tripartite ATP-independent transporter DctP family solute receptor|nr:TRAP transporter substrate-binding protein [Spirochaetales bacterium]
MKKIVLTGLCLFLAVGVFSAFAGGGGESGGAKTYEFSMGSAYDKAAPPVLAGVRYAEEVKAATNGAITINVFPNSAIGTEREQFTQVAANELEFTIGGMLTIDMYCAEYGFLSAPFLYKDMNHIKNIMASPLGDGMRKKFLENNTNLIGIVWRGIRNTSSNRAIRTPDDVKGLKIRMTEMPSWVAVWRDGLGGTTVPIVLGELYGALQNGVVDASEGPYEQLATYKFYEVQKFLVNTNHVMEWCGLYASQKMLDSLPPELSKILDDKAKSVMTDYGSQLCSDKAADFRQELLKGGMQEVNVNVSDFTNRLLPVYEKFFSDKMWSFSLQEVMSYAK